jgi:hypothetical protein
MQAVVSACEPLRDDTSWPWAVGRGPWAVGRGYVGSGFSRILQGLEAGGWLLEAEYVARGFSRA